MTALKGLLGTVYSFALSVSGYFAANSDASAAASDIISIYETLADAFRYAGILILIWGIFQTVLALKDDNTESKVKAAIILGLGVLLIGFKSFATSLYSLISTL